MFAQTEKQPLMSPPVSPNPLEAVSAAVVADEFLSEAVLDLQLYDDTLVALVGPELPKTFIEAILSRHWDGPVEVHCATDLMMGAPRTN